MRAFTILSAAALLLSSASASKCKPGTSSLVPPIDPVTTSSAPIPTTLETITTSSVPTTDDTPPPTTTTTSTTAPPAEPTCPTAPTTVEYTIPRDCTENVAYAYTGQPDSFWRMYCNRANSNLSVLSMISANSADVCMNACSSNAACAAAGHLAPANLCYHYSNRPTAVGGSNVYNIYVRYANDECPLA